AEALKPRMAAIVSAAPASRIQCPVDSSGVLAGEILGRLVLLIVRPPLEEVRRGRGESARRRSALSEAGVAPPRRCAYFEVAARCCRAAARPPGRWGTPARPRPISTPDNV